MGYAGRLFLIAHDDSVWRLANIRFERMLRAPANDCLPMFAGQRVRMAEIIVELTARVPVQIVRRVYPVQHFGSDGCMDLEQFDRQQSALVETTILPVLAVLTDGNDPTIVDATSRFVARGGNWIPSPALARVIDETALGLRRCARL